MTSPVRPLPRADAHRNREAILEATVLLINENPRASVAEIASRAGLGRATLYGHFHTRRDLVVAAFGRVMAEIDRRIADLDPSLAPEEALDELVATSWWVLNHFSGLTVAAASEVAAGELRSMHGQPLSRIAELLAQGRTTGVFRSDQSVAWQTECFYAILQAGAVHVRGGLLVPEEATGEMAKTIRAILATAPGGSGEALG